jgi:F-type H+-transporting ATPase subunit b
MEIVENIALISINGTLIIQLLSFLIFMFLINRIMIRPLSQVMVERREMMDRLDLDIVSARERCKDLGRQMQVQEDQARQAAFVIRDDIEAAGQKAADVLLTQARSEIDAIRRKTQQETEEKIATARSALQTEAAMIADRMVDALLGRKLGF